jgi:hypothetical protein
MPGSCCTKPVTRIIRVADVEAGIIGLDQALHNVALAGVTGEEEVMRELLSLIRAYGNYVPASREADYKHALLREFRQHINAAARRGTSA